MSLSSTTNRDDYTGNGAVDTYAYTFRIVANTDLLVTVRNLSNVETTLVITTDYTVTGVGGASGGNVVLVNSSQDWLDSGGDLLTNFILTIRRVRPLTQTADIRNQGSFLPETHEDVFDHLVMIAQQQQDGIDRSVKLSETVAASGFTSTLPVPTADYFLAINSANDGFSLVSSITTTNYSGTITFGVDASKAATPGVGDIYFASDTKLTYICRTAGAWESDLNGGKASDIASATTPDIGAATGNFVDITGTVTITGLGTIGAGVHRWLQFDGALTLTHNATSLILPGGANITTAAGDTALMMSLGSGNWKCLFYQYAGAVVFNTSINEEKGADIASAATTDIGAATGNYVDVTGTTTITALGTVKAGTRRIVQFDGILILTHNATSLILPTTANITTVAGDVARFVSLGSGNWKCVGYMRADGTALAGGLTVTNSEAFIVTTETTTSTSYTDLATAGPAVTITPGETATHLIFFKCLRMNNSAGSGNTFTSVSIAGAAASGDDAVQVSDIDAGSGHAGLSSFVIKSAVASGATHTMKYRVDADTGAWDGRKIGAVALT